MRLSAMVAVVLLAAGCSASPAVTGASQSPSAPARPIADPDLQLRPVLSAEPAAPGACTTTPPPAPGSQNPVAACSVDGTVAYSLGAAAVSGSQVASIAVGDPSNVGSAEIDITLDPAGTKALAAITGELAMNQPPRSQLAIYVHGQVQSAPNVGESIAGGAVVITGDFTVAEAQAIVDGLVQH